MNADSTALLKSPRTDVPIIPEVKALERDRLLTMGKGHPILVAEAPSGYGKTVLAHSWLRHAPAGCRRVWVSLNDPARDPAVFLERLILALTGTRPAERAAILDDEANRAERFAEIAEALASSQQPVWMVFDDVHSLAGSSSRLYLHRLLLGSGPSLRIFITMQPLEVDVGLGELTADGKVCWINADALILTRDEIEALALLRNYSQPSAQQLDWLTNATQGWPALVQLALTTLGSGPQLSCNLSRLGPVREYIYERFLARLQPTDRDLLWTLACIGSAPLDLLRALAPPPADPNVALPRLIALGIVQQEGSGKGMSIHLHPVVCEAVLRMLVHDRGDSRLALVLAAARWHWHQGLGTIAVRLLLESAPEHLDLAHAWLLELATPLNFKHGQHQTLVDLAEHWERIAGRHEPRLDRFTAWALIFLRRFASAQERLERALVADPEETDEVQLQKAVICALRDDYDNAGTLANDWLHRHGEEISFNVGAAWVVHAFQLKCAGDIAGARTSLCEAHSRYNQAQYAYGTAWAHVVGALTMIKIGRHRDALAEVEHGVEHCRAVSGHRAMLRSIEAYVRYERNELITARDMLDEALPLLPAQGIVDTIVLGFATAARLRVAAGDLGAALDILSEGERCGAQRGFPRLSLCLAAEQALILARSGATMQARQAAEMAGLVPTTKQSGGLRWDRASRLHARLALADGDASLALALVAPLLKRSRTAKQSYKLCELLILSAMADDQLGHEAAAFESLREALMLGAGEHYLRVFIDEDAVLLALIRRWLKCSRLTARTRAGTTWAERILGLAESKHHAHSPSVEAPLQSLNRRELQILALLDQGLSNAEIAARCFLVEGTIKWNLHNLYGKLGVRSRTSALRIAREQGILRN